MTKIYAFSDEAMSNQTKYGRISDAFNFIDLEYLNRKYPTKSVNAMMMINANPTCWK